MRERPAQKDRRLGAALDQELGVRVYGWQRVVGRSFSVG